MTLHVIGGGIAGLAAAVDATLHGQRVALYEAAARLGGRCASFFDRRLGVTIDNGTHVVVGANTATLRYLTVIGALGTLIPEPSGRILMRDLRSDQCFPATSRLGWRDTLAILRLATAPAAMTAARALSSSRAVPTFWQPLATAALNTPLMQADARLLWRTARRMFGSSRHGPTPLIAATSLAATYVDPAAKWLSAHGAELHMARPLTSIRIQNRRISALVFDDGEVALEPQDAVIFAVPFWSPLLSPMGFDGSGFEASPIVNIAYVDDELPDGPTSFVGLIGGVGQWLLRRGRTATVTVSAADELIGRSAATIAAVVWREIAGFLDRPLNRLPPFRVVKERRATLRHTAAVQMRRPGLQTPLANLVLAGDWVSPELPCTIESAALSGFAAASAARG